jgi:hypothetical protein
MLLRGLEVLVHEGLLVWEGDVADGVGVGGDGQVNACDCHHYHNLDAYVCLAIFDEIYGGLSAECVSASALWYLLRHGCHCAGRRCAWMSHQATALS